MSVNDLIKEWELEYDVGNLAMVSDGLKEIAHTAWHPMSEPFTREDGNEIGHILIRHESGAISSMPTYYSRFKGWAHTPPPTHWARIRDVVLMPLEEK